MTYPFDETTFVKDIVNETPKTSDIFKKYRIDFCCGGDRPLKEAAEERDVNIEQIIDELKLIYDKDDHGDDDIKKWLKADSVSLIEHIKTKYHRSLEEELPLLAPYVTKVSRVHGGNHPHLVRVHELFSELRKELLDHTKKEEETVFPMLLQLEDVTDETEKAKMVDYILELEKEHDHAGAILHELRVITEDFTPPADACGTYRLVYNRLEMLEGETFIHVHLETMFFSRVS